MLKVYYFAPSPGRRFMFEPTPSPSCTCFYCTLNSEWKQDRQEMMEEEKKKEYIRDYHEATAKCVLYSFEFVWSPCFELRNTSSLLPLSFFVS